MIGDAGLDLSAGTYIDDLSFGVKRIYWAVRKETGAVVGVDLELYGDA